MWEVIQQNFPYAVGYTIPLLIVALGALYCERSGIVNVGLEGLMVVGSFSAAFTIVNLQDKLPTSEYGNLALWIGIGVAVIVGIIFSLLHAFASINLKANQIISGTAINMIAGAITIFLARNITGSGNIRINSFVRKDIPLLSEIPIIGDLFFRETYATTWLVIGILLISIFIIYKTRFGLRLRSCGENPQAADAAGINVYKMRYVGVMISGGLAALGGAVILVTYSSEFNGSVGGLGFLALAALIFGQWKPMGILGATIFFGLANTVANISGIVDVPTSLMKTFPYVVTLLALIIFSKSSQAPKAAGEVFDSGKR